MTNSEGVLFSEVAKLILNCVYESLKERWNNGAKAQQPPTAAASTPLWPRQQLPTEAERMVSRSRARAHFVLLRSFAAYFLTPPPFFGGVGLEAASGSARLA